MGVKFEIAKYLRADFVIQLRRWRENHVMDGQVHDRFNEMAAKHERNEVPAGVHHRESWVDEKGRKLYGVTIFGVRLKYVQVSDSLYRVVAFGSSHPAKKSK